MRRTSPEIARQIVEMYIQNGNKTKGIAEVIGINKSTVVDVLKREGIAVPGKGQQNRKFTYDISFFKQVDTEEKAYWLGFIYADGCITNDGLELKISKKDIALLERFKKDIQSNHPIKHYVQNGYREGSEMIRLSIYSRELAKDLELLGAIQNKTHFIQFPDCVPDNLIPHFIRGYFDGDGSCTLYKVKGLHHYKFEVSIVGTSNFLEALKVHFAKGGLNPEVKLLQRHKERNDNIRTLKYSGVQNGLKVMKYLYQDATRYLDRKHERFTELSNVAVLRGSGEL